MLRSRFTRHLIAPIVVTLLAACSGKMGTQIEKLSTEASMDIAAAHTYRWDDSAMRYAEPKGGHMREFDSVLRDHVDLRLKQKGYQRVAKGNADMVLDYRVIVPQETAAADTSNTNPAADQTNPYGIHWHFDKDEKPTFGGAMTPKDEMRMYRTGVLHLGIFNPQGQMVWHSTATRILSDNSNDAEKRAALRITLDKLLDSVPARP